jgi:Cyclin-dependent kinase inhibitor 3 (CDKN3).
MKYRVPNLLEEYLRLGFISHYHPIEESAEPEIEQLIAILDDLKDVLENGGKVFIQ